MNLPFNQDKPEKVATRDGYGKALIELGKRNKRIVALCCDLTDSTRVEWFKQKFPDRFIEVGVAEQNMAGLAAGLALAGKIPFISSYAVFSPGRNWDQIRVSICYNNLNVKIEGAHAGISVGPDGATHQALEDIALMRVLPNMKVIVPCDAIQAEKATIAAAKINGPVYLRLGRNKVPVVTGEKTPFRLGKANVYREGKDVSIVACGVMVYEGLIAAEMLAKKGIQASVVDCHTIKPLDDKTLTFYAKKTGAVVSAEEHQMQGGLGGALAELFGRCCPVPMEFVGIHDRFGESGEPEELLKNYHCTSSDIVTAVQRVLKRKK